MSFEEAREAYGSGNKERFDEWLAYWTMRAEAPEYADNPYPKLYLEYQVVTIQYAAGDVADAIERLEMLIESVDATIESLDHTGQNPKEVPAEVAANRRLQLAQLATGLYELAREYEQG